MKKFLPVIVPLVISDIILVVWLLIRNLHFPMFEAAGIIAQKERALFLIVVSFGLLTVLSVIFIAFFIVWKYREDNHATYAPEWKESKRLMLLWWVIPSLIIAVLSVLTWSSTHALDPYKSLVSDTKPLRIQVVALQWKWLFIYPEQHIATVNYIVFPEKTPITFELTADAPMNSFWIPRLGGQMYAMSGMVTRTHLMADTVGEYAGSTAEISGIGFAGMKFIAKSTTDEEFARWVENMKQKATTLDREEYEDLAKPSEDTKPAFYASIDNNLYNEIVMKYMPSSSPHLDTNDSQHTMDSMPGM